jgi:hypothetical protein
MTRSTRALIAASALAAFATGCDNPFTDAPLEFRFTGAGITAPPGSLRTLEVQLVADGKPRPSREILFQAIPVGGSGAQVTLGPMNIDRPDHFHPYRRTTTNEQGRAFTQVRLGTVPGRAAVLVSSQGVQDTAWYTVQAAP